MDWNPIQEHESKSFPGVKFTIQRVTRKTRAKLNIALAAVNAEAREIVRELNTHREDVGRVPLPGQVLDDGTVTQPPTDESALETIQHIEALAAKLDALILERRNPILFEACLVKCDVKVPSGDIYNDGPESLVAEILDTITREYGMGLEPDDAKN